LAPKKMLKTHTTQMVKPLFNEKSVHHKNEENPKCKDGSQVKTGDRPKMRKQKKKGKQTRSKELLSTKAGTATSSPRNSEPPPL